MTISSNSNTCLDLNADTTITGNGKLTIINTAYYGVKSYKNKLLIKEANIDITAKDDGFFGKGEITFDHSTVTVTSTDKQAVYGYSSLSCPDSKIDIPVGGKIRNVGGDDIRYAITDSDGNIANKAKITPVNRKFDLYIAGTQVTDKNSKNILGDGAASFDPYTETLHIKKDISSAGDDAAIRICQQGITISTDKDAAVRAAKAPAIKFELSDEMTITGKGKLKLTSDNNTGIFSIGVVNITDANVETDGAKGIDCDNNYCGGLNFTNSDVSIKARQGFGVANVGNEINLKNCTIVKPVGAVITTTSGSGYCIMSGSGFATNIKILSVDGYKKWLNDKGTSNILTMTKDAGTFVVNGTDKGSMVTKDLPFGSAVAIVPDKTKLPEGQFVDYWRYYGYMYVDLSDYGQDKIRLYTVLSGSTFSRNETFVFDVPDSAITNLWKTLKDYNIDISTFNWKNVTYTLNLTPVICDCDHSGNPVHYWGSSPSCIGDGTAYHIYCKKCGHYFDDSMNPIKKDSWIIPKLGHSLKKVGKKSPTCTQDGNIAYYYCTRCEKYYSDSYAKTELTKADTVVSKTGHDWSAWKTTKEATTTAVGTEERTCSKCSAKQTRDIPKLTGYELYIAGTQVTSNNKNDILGKGEASYDPSTNTLTLKKNITVSSGYDYCVNSKIKGLTIVVDDDIALKTASIPLVCIDTTIKGSGKLTTISTDSTNTGVFTGTCTIDNIDVEMTAKE